MNNSGCASAKDTPVIPDMERVTWPLSTMKDANLLILRHDICYINHHMLVFKSIFLEICVNLEIVPT